MASLASRAGGKGEGLVRSLARFCQSTYTSDYVGFLTLLAVYVGTEFLFAPFHRMFSIDDINISYPHAETERVPVLMNIVYGFVVPFVTILLYNSLTGATVHKHHVALLGLGIAIVLASAITDIIKNMVGRPRPDLLARCKPTAGTPVNTLVAHTVCTETDYNKLHDGWRSFPSGHSSFAFAGLGYLSLFLAGQLQIFVLRNTSSSATSSSHVRGDLGRALLCLLPLLGATIIAISRCQDYRHDVYDVCVGSLLGWSAAYWSYRRYWPRLDAVCCDKPYAAPEPLATDLSTYGRLRDEEEGIPV